VSVEDKVSALATVKVLEAVTNPEIVVAAPKEDAPVTLRVD